LEESFDTHDDKDVAKVLDTCLAEVRKHQPDWHLDSSASDHVTGDVSLITNVVPIASSIHMNTTNGASLSIVGK
jgi:hypothetical protein